MIITYFRSSSLSNLEFCEQQYFLTYNLGLVRKAGVKAAKGSVVHKALECLATFKQEFDATSTGALVYDDKSLGLLSVERDSLHTKETANLVLGKAFDYFSKQEGNNFTKKDYNDTEKWLYNGLWYQNGMFDPRKRTVIEAEPHFDITIDKPWANYHYYMGDKELEGQLAIKGTIDLITQIDSTTIEIIDWKTGERKNWATGEEKTYEKLCKDPQLMLYYYAAKKMYPWAENIILTIFFLRDGDYKGGPFTVCFDVTHVAEMEATLKKQFEYVKRMQLPKMLSPTQKDFRCTRICDFYKTNWPGTDVNKCKFIHQKIKQHGIDYVEQNFKAEGHDMSFYQNPGE